MRYKPTRKIIEAGLDSLIVQIYIDPTKKKIESFGSAVAFFEKAGYSLREYKEIYEEFRNNFDKLYWRDNGK